VSDRAVDAGPSMRIVSLVPSVTETLSAWGRTPIACTRFCERPDLPHVGGTKDPDVGRIADLAPDLVVVDAEENRRQDHDALVAQGLDVHVLRIRSLADVDPAMTGLSARVAARWVPLHLPERAAESARAFVPIWRRPWMSLGMPTYGSSLLAHLGVGNIFEDRGPYPTVTLEEAADRQPRLVIAPSEPYPFTRRQLPELESVGPTLFVDGRDLFWWGVRTPGALDRLGSQLAGR
jgi:ABC-type Fe3+-hydroxamate transport system substrate-binding protein